MTARDYENIQRMIDATIKHHLEHATSRGELIATMTDLDTYEQDLQQEIQGAKDEAIREAWDVRRDLESQISDLEEEGL